MYFKLKIAFVVFFMIILGINTIPNVYAEELDFFTDRDVYSDGQPLFVYGRALSNENLILRIFAPDGTIAKFDQLIVAPKACARQSDSA